MSTCTWLACENEDTPVFINDNGYCFAHALATLHNVALALKQHLHDVEFLRADPANDDEAAAYSEEIRITNEKIHEVLGDMNVSYLIRRCTGHGEMFDGYIYAVATGETDWQPAREDAEWFGEPVQYEMLEVIGSKIGERVFPAAYCDECNMELPGDWPYDDNTHGILCDPCRMAGEERP